MTEPNTQIGRLSLWTSILGVLVPGSLAIIVAIVEDAKGLRDEGTYYGLCAALFLVLQLIALGCGIASRRTPTGRAALTISGLSLTLTLVIVFVISMFSWSPSQRSPPPSVPQIHRFDAPAKQGAPAPKEERPGALPKVPGDR